MAEGAKPRPAEEGAWVVAVVLVRMENVCARVADIKYLMSVEIPALR